MKAPASIPRRSALAPDTLGFDALRLQAISAAQQASGSLWTDYNLHDPGVTLLEALCFALTEDLFAARRPVPELLGLGPRANPADWARFGLHSPEDLLPCHPATERDWQLWLQQQLPQARQLRMQALCDSRGHGNGLWRMTLQSQREATQDQLSLRAQALQAYAPQRNLGEDLAAPPELLRPRWVELEISLQLHGQRDICELLAELLQRCDDCISARLPDGLPSPGKPQPDAEGPLGRSLSAMETHWLGEDPDFLFLGDLARNLQDVPGLAAITELRLRPHGGADQPSADEPAAPPGAVRRRGPGWAMRLRWPEYEAQLRGWRLAREAGPVQMPVQALLQTLADQRLRLRMDSARPSGPQVPAPAEAPSPLPPVRDDHYPASAALPPLYHQVLRAQARMQPGLHAQWQGYLCLLEHGLNQVQVQREQLPRLYDLLATDAEGSRSYWTSLPGDAQLPGVEALYRQPRTQLAQATWIDEAPLSRRHRVLDVQLALHGEALDHAGLQALPCYFSPAAWPVHLLRLKRQFARRLLRLGRRRAAGADLSRPLIGQPDNTPPLQERLGLMLGLAQTHSRLLSPSWQAQALPAPQEGSAPPTGDAAGAAPPSATQQVLNPASRRRPADWGLLRRALPVLKQPLPAPLLRAAVRPELFQWAPAGPLAQGPLWLGPDEAGHHWPLASALDEAQAGELASSLHAAACQLQAAAEGMHLVEHLLLRPLGTTPPPARRYYALAAHQLTLVFSGWTARGADPRFRRLATQLLARQAPAYLRCQILWLDAPQMQAFETLWHAWLAAREAYAQALVGTLTPSTAPLDALSSRLRERLRGQLVAQYLTQRRARREASHREGAA